MNEEKNNPELAPIVMFAYNRPPHLQRAVEALRKNALSTQSDLIVYSDGPKNLDDKERVEEVRKYLRAIEGFKSVRIVTREHNNGLARSVIAGVTEIVQQYGRIIVVEDDLVTSPYFLKFMNEGLSRYEQDERVISIHGYTYPTKMKLPETYFMKGADCWGWATWKRGWDLFEPDVNTLIEQIEKNNLQKPLDFNGSFPYVKMLHDQSVGKIDSWGVRWHVAAFLHDKLTLYPGRSLVQHIGNDSSGTHLGTFNDLDVELYEGPIEIRDIPVEENEFARKEWERFFRTIRRSFFGKVVRRLERIFGIKRLF